mmetsp:Transcript_49398/g.105137  ORF Transcript_49398/g.105137 Transcript_49398/m.105137 type:complete len:330 (+) Transcript_49398:138-1127(+)
MAHALRMAWLNRSFKLGGGRRATFATASSRAKPIKAILVDGTSTFSGAFHQSPPETTPEVSAERFVQDMVSLQRKVPDCTHFCVFWDSNEKLDRREELPSYKAYRDSYEDNFRARREMVQATSRAFGWAPPPLEGHEADDLIFSAIEAIRKKTQNYSVVICSRDKDVYSMVEPAVNVLPGPTSEIEEAIDDVSIQDKFGIAPSLLLDYRALVGDTVDGVPGVPGVGPKRATTLLQLHGSLQGIFECAAGEGGDLGPGMGKSARSKLLEHQEQALKIRALLAPRLVSVPQVKKFHTEFSFPRPSKKWKNEAEQFCKKEGLVTLGDYIKQM